MRDLKFLVIEGTQIQILCIQTWLRSEMSFLKNINCTRILLLWLQVKELNRWGCGEDKGEVNGASWTTLIVIHWANHCVHRNQLTFNSLKKLACSLILPWKESTVKIFQKDSMYHFSKMSRLGLCITSLNSRHTF